MTLQRATVAARFVLGAIFIYAAYLKVGMSWLTFAQGIISYQLLPEAAVIPIAKLLPWFELALGLLLISGVALRWTGLASVLMLGFFLFAMIRAHYFLHLDIDCGCFGPGEKVSSNTLVRDGSFVVLAVITTVGAFLSGPRMRHRLQ